MNRVTENFVIFLPIIIWVLCAGGWVANIYKLINTGLEVSAWGGMEIARCVGVFVAPLGAVLGYF